VPPPIVKEAHTGVACVGIFILYFKF